MNKGQALIEYAFILSLVMVIVIIGITLFGQQLAAMYQNIVNMF